MPRALARAAALPRPVTTTSAGVRTTQADLKLVSRSLPSRRGGSVLGSWLSGDFLRLLDDPEYDELGRSHGRVADLDDQPSV
jgi:hypothetical protein